MIVINHNGFRVFRNRGPGLAPDPEEPLRFSTEALELLQAATEEIHFFSTLRQKQTLVNEWCSRALQTKRSTSKPKEIPFEEYLMYLFADGYLASTSDIHPSFFQLQNQKQKKDLACMIFFGCACSSRQRPIGGA